MSTSNDSIVALDRFILSTRDSGYKNTTSAISELVDNAIQAGATHVQITTTAPGGDETNATLVLSVTDNGSGMDKRTLTQALRFGGSSRYNSRHGLGRFGMGLPNASLGQARRVTVYTWQQHGSFLMSYLDVDEIASGDLSAIPVPKSSKRKPPGVEPINCDHGTCVVWERCDRLDNKRQSTLVKKLHQGLGRTFRHFLVAGVDIAINGEFVVPRDPLYLQPQSQPSGARMFQEVWECELYSDPLNFDSEIGRVEVIFTELPVDAWHDMSNERKREIGVANGAGVSIVRGRREVDFGWFFMGAKRRENYDDWWRCEIKFEPVLDEAFGITHTKQQIRPKEYLIDALTPYIESMAKALNIRARNSYADVKSAKITVNAEQLAGIRDERMKPLPLEVDATTSTEVNRLIERHPVLRQSQQREATMTPAYHLVEDELSDACFFKSVNVGGAVIGVINPRHQFYKSIYSPIVAGKDLDQADVANALQLVFLAAARAELSFVDIAEKTTIEKFRNEWSHAMDVLLAKR